MAEQNLNGNREINDDVINKFLRFFIEGEKDNCWLWFGSLNEDGYGRFICNYEYYFAHRVSYLYYNSLLKSTLLVLHKRECFNKNCVNPNHLYSGTQKDNQEDRSIVYPESYNHCKGESNIMHKLTEQDIRDIRYKKKRLGYKYHQLAKEYSINEAYIGLIVQGKAWKHVK